MSNLDRPAARVPIGYVMVGGQRLPVEVDSTWFRVLFGLYERAGGTNGLSTTDVDAGGYAAMQPAIQEAVAQDVMQGGVASFACAQDVSQTDFTCQPMADIFQG